MKKKYFTPEMEELEFDVPVVLGLEEGSCPDDDMKLCPTKGCDGDTCPDDVE